MSKHNKYQQAPAAEVDPTAVVDPTAEVDPTAVVDPTIEQALAPKQAKAKANGDRLGLYLVLTGKESQVIRKALQQCGIDNYASYIRGLVLADLKQRIAI